MRRRTREGARPQPQHMGIITERIGHLATLETEQRSGTPPLPRSVKIELTGRCDFQCYFCASHTRPRARSDMPWERYTRHARELRELGVEQLGVFYLGESLLCDWLADAIRFAKRECGYPYVFLTTNGQLATAARVRECMLAGLDSLKFAVNCCDPAQLHAVAGRTSGTRGACATRSSANPGTAADSIARACSTTRRSATA
jgi:MoaA/NifB/PqqE/SkfB family radical SAM enzyme